VSGLFTEYHYYGTGDVGGAPRESSVKLLEAIINKRQTVLPVPRRFGQEQPAPAPGGPVLVGDGPVHVVSSTAEQMFLDIKPDQVARLPRYQGELELTNHSAGSLTSEAYQKRWNRKNELLADAAEKSSLLAEWLGGRRYPLQRLNNAWTLVLGGQFHDIMAGTATPQSYNYAWNDDVIAMNQFAGVLTSATAAVASGLNTEGQGTPLVVYNPLNVAREDVVEAEVHVPGGDAKGLRVLGPDGTEVPAQMAGNRILFLAKVPSTGYAVYDVRPAVSGPGSVSQLKVSDFSLENARYKITVDQNGDVSSIFDKAVGKELLSAPVRLALQTEKPHDWPAWNMDWEDEKKPPRGYVQGPAKVRVVENGPVRVALQIERETEDSKFVQTVRLSAGDAGNRVEFVNAIDWKAKEAALKAVFPLTAVNPEATYNWDVGTIRRGNSDEKKFEVPSHQWIDLTDKSGAYGVTILSDCKYGSDKPDDNTLRLTLIYTPGMGAGNGRAYSDQLTQDMGHHEIIFGLAGHPRDWREAQTDWQAYRLNQPLMAFESAKHPGALGKELSLLKVSNTRVRVLALKKAEQSDEIVVRLVEIDGNPASDVHLKFAAPVVSAREVNGQEAPLGPAKTVGGELVTAFTPFQLHTFALKLAPAQKPVTALKSQAMTLAYDTSVATFEDKPSQGCFDCLLDEPTAPQGKALPAEMLPPAIEYAGIRFSLAAPGKPNAASAHGQTIPIPAGKFNRVYLLAASANGDQKATFLVDDKPVELTIQEWSGKIGQWDNRSWTTHQEGMPSRAGAPARMRTVMDFAGTITPGFIKRDDVAWFASHLHGPDGNFEAYSYSYLFAYPIDLPANAKTLTLPDNPRIRILAITAADEPGKVHPAQPLYDTLEPAP
jgi:alpha-mannosidase